MAGDDDARGHYRELDWRVYLRAVYRRRRLAGAAFLLTFSASFLYAITATPIYRATARLLVEDRNPRVVNFPEVVVQRSNSIVQFSTTQRDTLRSRALARATIDRLGLWDHPEFGGAHSTPSALRYVSRLASYVVSAIRSADLPAGSPRSSTTRREATAISSLMRNLEIGAGRNSRVVAVSFNSRDARLAADVANALARIYIERDMEFRYTSSREASQWLRQRTAEERERLEASERALHRYREDHGAAAIEDRRDMIVKELAKLHSDVTAATQARISSEGRYRDLVAAQRDGKAVERFPGVLEGTFVKEHMLNVARLQRQRARLSEELGPLHPGMVRIESSIRDGEERLRNEIEAVVDSARLEFQAARSWEQELLAEFDRQTAAALALDRTGIEYGVLKREAASARQLYASLLQRAAETSVTAELETTNLRILDEAEVPGSPARPRKQLIHLIGLMGGVLMALGLVLVREYLDDAGITR